MSTSEYHNIRKLLPRVWMTFFAQFGNLLPIQCKAIPVILGGKSALLMSATATGKTEAVIAPLLEQLLSNKWSGLSILYISPTRALANDMYHRLSEQFKELNLSLAVRTGERKQFKPKTPPNALITTPESLDSLICRSSEAFRNLKAVILDDIHLIDNTYRGDQLRILLRRLKQLVDYTFNVYILSATLADPQAVADRYMTDADYEILITHEKREILYTLVKSPEEVLDYAKKEKLGKLLFFCNTRRAVEDFASKCMKLWGSEYVVVHHGSLSRNKREEAERFMRESKFGICVATMTLEIGIDIGDIDAVVLAEPPLSLSSMLQRIGRGNRRKNMCRVFAIYNSDDERRMLEEMFNKAIQGELEETQYTPDLSVTIQQIFSCLYEHREGLTDDYFVKLFNDFCNVEDLMNILRHLEKQGFIRKHYEKWFGTEKLLNWGERGIIHSNIPSEEEQVLTVIDIDSGRQIGHIDRHTSINEVFTLAGYIWKTINVKGDRVFVKRIETSNEEPESKFKLRKLTGRFYQLLPTDIQMRIEAEINS